MSRNMASAFFTFSKAPYYGTTVRKDLIGKMLWGVGLRLVMIQGLRLFGFAQIVAAIVTELSANTIRFTAS